MIYREFQGSKLSLLGFGCMRLPLLEGGTIDQNTLDAMVDAAIRKGVNYFDTAWPYHGGHSETAIGKSLSRYPRESWFLADKYPGHQTAASYDPAAIFEAQLKKCGVEYFDFYLLHNVCENSIDVYEDPQWGIIEYFKEQKRLGRIRHLGFSSHARPACLESFLQKWGQDMEFCQIQLNFLDWTLQEGEKKLALLKQYDLPVWVMEPLRGGRLAHLAPEWEQKFRSLRPEESIPGWSFRFLQDIPQVHMILSGMSDLPQMEDNLRTFEAEKPLTKEEQALLSALAATLKGDLPCTGCRYCTEVCPMGLDIPNLLREYSDAKVSASFTVAMFLDTLPEEKRPSACIGCGQCRRICPQGIDIPTLMQEFAALATTLPNWAQVCREREAAARALAEKKA